MRNGLLILALVFLGVLAFASARFVQNGRRSAAAQAQTVAHTDLAGVWLGKGIQSLSPSDPMGKKRPDLEEDIPFTPWSLARMKSQRPATGPDQTFENTNDPALKYADPDGYPRASIHPMKFKIVQGTDYVYFLWEYNQSWRQIAMNRPHSDDPDPTWFGEAVGKWEGDALVVDTVGIKDTTWLDPIGHPHSEDLHIVERFRRVDHDTLVDQLTFEDPKAYTRPWTGQLTFKLDPTSTMRESIYTISDELRFRKHILNQGSDIPVRPGN